MEQTKQTMDASVTATKNSAQESEEEKTAYSYSQRLLYMVLAGLVLAVGIVAALICRAQVKVMENEVIVSQQNLAQTWVETSLENLGVGVGKVLEPINFMSQAEMFRLFVNDVTQAVGDDLARLKSPEVLENEDHELHSMTEELAYLRDLMLDSSKRQGWMDVGLFNQNGLEIIRCNQTKAIQAHLKPLFLTAKDKRQPTFSSIYGQGQEFLVDIVEPLYEVMSNKEPKVVGYLVVTLPVKSLLLDILSKAHLQNNDFRPSLLTFDSQGYHAFTLDAQGHIFVVKHENVAAPKLTFAKRKSYVDDAEVVSHGARLSNPLWYVLVEKKADLVDAEISSNAREIYGLGVLGSLSIALTLAIIVGTFIARSRAQEGQKCIGGLVHAIECALDGSDPQFRYLQGRSLKVAKLSLRLAKILKLSTSNQENINLAARLSQVGKIFVPREIMTKRGILTDAERKQVQLAPYHAYNVLKGVLPKRVALIVYQMGGKVVDDAETGANHELTPAEMLIEARVLLVANDFCAMTSQRGNRPPLPLPTAREKLLERTLYDREVIAAINKLSDDEIKAILDIA